MRIVVNITVYEEHMTHYSLFYMFLRNFDRPSYSVSIFEFGAEP